MDLRFKSVIVPFAVSAILSFAADKQDVGHEKRLLLDGRTEVWIFKNQELVDSGSPKGDVALVKDRRLERLLRGSADMPMGFEETLQNFTKSLADFRVDMSDISDFECKLDASGTKLESFSFTAQKWQGATTYIPYTVDKEGFHIRNKKPNPNRKRGENPDPRNEPTTSPLARISMTVGSGGQMNATMTPAIPYEFIDKERKDGTGGQYIESFDLLNKGEKDSKGLFVAKTDLRSKTATDFCRSIKNLYAIEPRDGFYHLPKMTAGETHEQEWEIAGTNTFGRYKYRPNFTISFPYTP